MRHLLRFRCAYLSSHRSRFLAVALAIGVVSVGLKVSFDVAHAHDGDPKATSLLPAYRGPGYRSGVPQASGPAFDFPCSGMVLLSWLPLDEFSSGLDNGNDCWGYVSPSGREYAIFGTSGGTGFVDVTTPGNPTILAFIPGVVSLWRDVKVHDAYAYSVSEGGGGIQVFDLTQIDQGTVTELNNVTSGGTTETHNVAIDTTSGYLYRTGGGPNGLRIYSLANPAQPVYVGEWPDRYVHDATIVTYESGTYAGKQIAFCCSGFDGGWVEPGIDIVDVTDKTNPILLSRYEYPDAVYSHQAWLSEDRQYLYLNDELDEANQSINTRTRVIDVSDLSNPFVVTTFSTGLPAVDHNLYVSGDLIYQANYRSGLRIFDASNPTTPIEVAYFDTYPPNDGAEFNGLWSSYPFFPSGTIIGSDIEKGLFVWRLGDPPLAGSFVNPPPDRFNPFGGTEIDIQVTEQSGGVLSPGSATLRLRRSSGGEELLSGTEISSGVFRFTIPALPCGERVLYSFEATATDGWNLRLPGVGDQTAYVGDELTVFIDDFESDAGWQAGLPSDDATTGIWERVEPIGTAAQASQDHSDPGTFCYVTGQGTPGGQTGEADIDGGITTLVTPVLSPPIGTNEAWVSYWRWYSNSLGATDDDVLEVEIATEGGPWISVETLDASTDGWEFSELPIGLFVDPAEPFQLRIIAADTGSGSIVEAAIDDFSVTWVICDDCDDDGVADGDQIIASTGADCNANGQLDACDIEAGVSADTNGNGIPDECECTPFVRGDTNADLVVDVSDAIYALDFLFDGGPMPSPIDSVDINDDSSRNIADVVYILAFLFQSGDAPPPPFDAAGCDPTP